MNKSLQLSPGPATDDTSFSNNDYARMEQWLSDKYDFRYDLLKGVPYYLEKKSKKWIEISDRKIASISRRMRLDGIKHDTKVADLLLSDYAPDFHAIRNYFENNKRYFSHNNKAIKDLAATINVGNEVGSENWEPYLRKWLVGCVASGLNNDLKGAKNHVCLVLCGGQGVGKTTWLNNLCPPDLIEYFFANKIDIKNKDLLATLCNCFLINIDDQLKSIGQKSSDELKNLITMPFLKYRRSYGRVTETHPRIASFMGSINDMDFLDDPTGSRRFLSFVVNSIDYKKQVSINEVWAEAYNLYKEGFVYWFEGKEIEQLNKHNRQFQTQTLEEEILMSKYRPANKGEGDFLTPAEILNELLNNTNIKNLGIYKLGRALTKHGFEKWQKGTNKIGGYSVIRI